METNGTALARIEPQAMTVPGSRAAVAPRNIDDVYKMAQAVAKSGLYGVKSPEEAMIRMATGMELGFSMMQSIRGVFVMTVGGKQQPGLYADMMVAACKAHPDVCEYFRLVESTGQKATYATKRRGEPEEARLSFTIEQAKQAGLAGKDVWKSFPDAMLRARASTALARAVYPDLLNGLYSIEELRDVPASSRTSITPDGEVIEQPAQLEGQLTESIAIEQDKLCEDLEGDLKRAATEDDAYAVGQLISKAHSTQRITDAHRVRLRKVFADVSKKLSPKPVPGQPANEDQAP